MIIPSMKSTEEQPEYDQNGLIKSDKPEVTKFLSILQEVRLILETPFVKNLLGDKIKGALNPDQQQPQQNNVQRIAEKEADQEQKEEVDFEKLMLDVISKPEGVKKLCDALDMIKDIYGDKKISELKTILIKEAGAMNENKSK